LRFTVVYATFVRFTDFRGIVVPVYFLRLITY
jgi:hypothetical protein